MIRAIPRHGNHGSRRRAGQPVARANDVAPSATCGSDISPPCSARHASRGRLPEDRCVPTPATGSGFSTPPPTLHVRALFGGFMLLNGHAVASPSAPMCSCSVSNWRIASSEEPVRDRLMASPRGHQDPERMDALAAGVRQNAGCGHVGRSCASVVRDDELFGHLCGSIRTALVPGVL